MGGLKMVLIWLPMPGVAGSTASPGELFVAALKGLEFTLTGRSSTGVLWIGWRRGYCILFLYPINGVEASGSKSRMTSDCSSWSKLKWSFIFKRLDLKVLGSPSRPFLPLRPNGVEAGSGLDSEPLSFSSGSSVETRGLGHGNAPRLSELESEIASSTFEFFRCRVTVHRLWWDIKLVLTSFWMAIKERLTIGFIS